MATKTTTESLGIIPSASGVSTYKIVEAPKTTSALSAQKTMLRGSIVPRTSNPAQVSAVNPKSTIGLGESFLIKSEKVGNVYAGSKIDPLYVYPVKTGERLYLQIQENVAASLGSDNSAGVTLPFSLSLSAKVPDACLDAQQKAEVVTESFLRLSSLLYPNGTADLSTLKEMLIGKLI